MDLIATPHHDGSERHVSTLEPTLGERVTVWLRVPHAEGATRVWVRTTPDGEPHFVAAVVDRSTPHETWWRTDIEVRNAVTNYRFLLDGGPVGYRFVNGTGVHARTVSDTSDFRLSAYSPPPPWLADTSFYQVFPDRFASSDAPRKWPPWAAVAAWDDPVATDGARAVRQVYGGDLAGVEAHLDHLASFGAGGLYLTPFFPAPSSHRYDAETFDHVDPFLGGDDALAHLVRSCHDRGIRVIGDLTINHVGARHEWFRAAQADPASVEAGFFHFRDHPDDYEAWFDVLSLPKLDLRNPELCRRLLAGPDSVTARWLRPPFDLDGWRVDVANMAGRLRDVNVNREVAGTMRATMAATKPDTYLVAEHAYDASRDLDGDGWHGVMNYLSFTRPVWCWLRRDDAEVKFLGDPLPVPRFGGTRPRRRCRKCSPSSRGAQRCPGSTCSGRTTPRGSAACAVARPGRWLGPACCTRCPASRWSSPVTSWASPASTETAPGSQCSGTSVGGTTRWSAPTASSAHYTDRRRRCVTAVCAGSTSVMTCSSTCANPETSGCSCRSAEPTTTRS